MEPASLCTRTWRTGRNPILRSASRSLAVLWSREARCWFPVLGRGGTVHDRDPKLKISIFPHFNPLVTFKFPLEFGGRLIEDLPLASTVADVVSVAVGGVGSTALRNAALLLPALAPVIGFIAGAAATVSTMSVSPFIVPSAVA